MTHRTDTGPSFTVRAYDPDPAPGTRRDWFVDITYRNVADGLTETVKRIVQAGARWPPSTMSVARVLANDAMYHVTARDGCKVSEGIDPLDWVLDGAEVFAEDYPPFPAARWTRVESLNDIG